MLTGALIVERPADIEEGYALTAPLLYHFGHKTPADNWPLYNLLITRLAEMINMRCNSNSRSKHILNYFHVLIHYYKQNNCAHSVK